MSKKSDRGTNRPKLEEKPAERQPVGESTTKACGCVEQTFSDDTLDIQPCVAHGLVQVANCLVKMAAQTSAAANALGYVGLKLAKQDEMMRDQMAMEQDGLLPEDTE